MWLMGGRILQSLVLISSCKAGGAAQKWLLIIDTRPFKWICSVQGRQGGEEGAESVWGVKGMRLYVCL